MAFPGLEQQLTHQCLLCDDPPVPSALYLAIRDELRACQESQASLPGTLSAVILSSQ